MDLEIQLSKNFKLKELVHSTTATARGIDNTPDEKVASNLTRLCQDILQPIRDEYGHSININSGYRCDALNKSVGGAKTSQHLTGEAVDISCTATTKAELFRLIHRLIMEERIKVGQLIWEYGSKTEPRWVHVSLPRTNKPNNQILYLFSK